MSNKPTSEFQQVMEKPGKPAIEGLINRRGFLKLAGLLSLGLSAPRLDNIKSVAEAGSDSQNILIVVFDAFSAYNMSLYGYPRDTTPNINRIANQAIVYHNHFAGGSFTTPGTASLFTGVLPWTHRAFNLNDTIDKAFADKNVFHLFPNHYRMAYTHNPLADTLIRQYRRDIEGYTSQEKLLLNSNPVISKLLLNDSDIAYFSWSRIVKLRKYGSAYSLFLSFIYEQYIKHKIAPTQADFPLGLPNVQEDNYYRLEDAIDWLQNRLNAASQPFFGYFHFFPPHDPYFTRKDFYHRFAKDGYLPLEKPAHIISPHRQQSNLNAKRIQYDEYILYVDEEFGRLYDFIKKSGLDSNTRIILTSDHGELFERGVRGHETRLLNQPIVRVPLIIFEPGEKTRKDIYTPTSAIDLLPTLLYRDHQSIPAWIEGIIMPPYNPSPPDPERSVFIIQARDNQKYAPFRLATVMLLKNHYKLIYYFGYKELKDIGDLIELYDIQNDPEEMKNLYPAKKALGDELLAEVKAKLGEVNAPYERSG